MLTQVRKIKIDLAPGTIVSSQQMRRLCTTATDVTFPVGDTLTIPENLTKVIMTEVLGSIVLERYFLQWDGVSPREILPLYVKIYDRQEANVLLFQDGIAMARNMLRTDGTKKRSMFLRDSMFTALCDEAFCQDRVLYDLLQETRDLPEENIANDECTCLLRDGEKLNAGKPWDLSKSIDHPLMRQYCQREEEHGVSRLACAMMEGLYSWDRDLFRNPPAMHTMLDYFLPHTGVDYEPIAFDPLSRVCCREPVISLAMAIKRSGIPAPKSAKSYLAPTGTDRALFDKLTEYSSEILSLCVWLQALPLHEVMFSYTLPNRNDTGIRLSSFVMHHCEARTVRNYSIHPGIVDNVFSCWDSNICKKVVVMKTKEDECFIVWYGTDGMVRRLFIDLTVATLMSQAIISVE